MELSLEVQGGQDYFRFVEGTCIIACVLSFCVLSSSSSGDGSGSGRAAIPFDYSSNISKHERSEIHNKPPMFNGDP